MTSPTSDPTPRPPSSHLDALGTAACVMLALVTIGFAAFRRFNWTLPTGASHNADRTFLTSVNAVTLTGFKQSFAEVPNFPAGGLLLLALLAVGGAMTTLVTAGLFLRSILDVEIRTRTIVLLAAATIVAPMLLVMPIGFFDATSAATTLGLAGRYAPPGGAIMLLVAAAVPAAVGPLAIASVVGRREGGGWRAMRSTLAAFAIVYLVGTLALATLGGLPVAGASTLALDARALGLNDAMPTSVAGATQWLVLGLMAIGSAPGGLAGGVGLLPLILVGRHAVLALRGRGDASPLVGVSVVWIAGWVASLFAALVALAVTQPQVPGDRLLFIVVSALSNAGLSHDPISISGFGSVILALAMIAGRMLPLLMLCWMATLADRARRAE